GRSISLARGHGLARDEAVGYRRERAHLRLPRRDSRARGDQGAANAYLELPQVRGAAEAREVLFLYGELGTAEPGRAVHEARAQGREEDRARPEHAVHRRHGGART